MAGFSDDDAPITVRLPGGMLLPAQLEAIAVATARFASSTMELTRPGNLRVGGVGDPDAFAEAIADAGLLPSTRVRNVLASPLTGRLGGNADVRDLVWDLDDAIQTSATLAELPDGFWFGIDDGRGDVSGLRADVGAHLLDDTTAALLVSGVDTGVRTTDVVPSLIEAAELVLDGRRWATTEVTWPAITRPPVGWIEQDDGRVALGAGVPLGMLTSRVGEYLAAVDAPLVLTPWRSVLVCDLDEGVADAALRVLAPMGLIFDETSPWLAADHPGDR